MRSLARLITQKKLGKFMKQLFRISFLTTISILAQDDNLSSKTNAQCNDTENNNSTDERRIDLIVAAYKGLDNIDQALSKIEEILDKKAVKETKLLSEDAQNVQKIALVRVYGSEWENKTDAEVSEKIAQVFEYGEHLQKRYKQLKENELILERIKNSIKLK